MKITLLLPCMMTALVFQAVAQTPLQFCVDVSLQTHTFKDQDPDGNYKGYSQGNCFFIWGVVYPEGTFLKNGPESGLTAEGAPSMPDDVIGRFNSRGWVIENEDPTRSGIMALTKHILMIDKEHIGLGPFQLVTSGDEPNMYQEMMTRSVNGGTDTMRTFKGEEYMVFVGENASGARNATLCFSLDNLLDFTSTSETPPNPNTKFGMQLTPNPARGEVNIEISNIFQTDSEGIIYITDIQGKVIHSEKLWIQSNNQRHKIALHRILTGMYFVRLEAGAEIITKTLIIQP